MKQMGQKPFSERGSSKKKKKKTCTDMTYFKRINLILVLYVLLIRD